MEFETNCNFIDLYISSYNSEKENISNDKELINNILKQSVEGEYIFNSQSLNFDVNFQVQDLYLGIFKGQEDILNDYDNFVNILLSDRYETTPYVLTDYQNEFEKTDGIIYKYVDIFVKSIQLKEKFLDKISFDIQKVITVSTDTQEIDVIGVKVQQEPIDTDKDNYDVVRQEVKTLGQKTLQDLYKVEEYKTKMVIYDNINMYEQQFIEPLSINSKSKYNLPMSLQMSKQELLYKSILTQGIKFNEGGQEKNYTYFLEYPSFKVHQNGLLIDVMSDGYNKIYDTYWKNPNSTKYLGSSIRYDLNVTDNYIEQLPEEFQIQMTYIEFRKSIIDREKVQVKGNMINGEYINRGVDKVIIQDTFQIITQKVSEDYSMYELLKNDPTTQISEIITSTVFGGKIRPLDYDKLYRNRDLLYKKPEILYVDDEDYIFNFQKMPYYNIEFLNTTDRKFFVQGFGSNYDVKYLKTQDGFVYMLPLYITVIDKGRIIYYIRQVNEIMSFLSETISK